MDNEKVFQETYYTLKKKKNFSLRKKFKFESVYIYYDHSTQI